MTRSISVAIIVLLLSQSARAQADSSTINDCSPSIPLEIVAAQALWGMPIYWVTKATFNNPNDQSIGMGPMILPTYFLLMAGVGITSELTSDCEASNWHLLWIGLATHLPTSILSFSLFKDVHPRKFNIWEYTAYSIVPTVLSVLWYNTFLEPQTDKPERPSENEGFVAPEVGPKYFGLRYQLRL